jgi:hypothetical protein
MPNVNPGPAVTGTVNTQAPVSYERLIQTISVNMTPVAVAANTSAEQSFGANGVSQATAATGILAGDVILGVSPPSLTAGTGIVGFRCDTATNDKFYVEFGNFTAGSLTPASGQWLITVARYNTSSGTASPGTLANLPSSIY